jgi:hypothetical protein
MRSHLSNRWNNAVAYVEMRFGSTQLSTGSAFFWLHTDRIFLVTNWHNLTGRDSVTGKLLSPTGAIPDRVVVFVFKQVSHPDPDGFFELDYVPVEISIVDPISGTPCWFEHPAHGCAVDIAAIDVTIPLRGYMTSTVNTVESDGVLPLATAQEVFTVGFPFGQIANAPAPIWKRGSIALDPTFDPEGLPKMLIDSATRKGMSGSVVVARHFIAGTTYTKKNGAQSDPMLFAKLDIVVGIYSGCHYPDLEKAQLGIVWKRSAIEETVSAQKLAKPP